MADLNALPTANVKQNDSVVTRIDYQARLKAQETLAAGRLNDIPPAPVSGTVGHNINTTA